MDRGDVNNTPPTYIGKPEKHSVHVERIAKVTKLGLPHNTIIGRNENNKNYMEHTPTGGTKKFRSL